MKKLRAWSVALRKSSTVPRTSTDTKSSRAPWFGRLLSTAFDLGFYSMVFYFITTLMGMGNLTHSASVLVVSFPVYYLVVEGIFGRSIGKMFMGYKMSIPESVSPRGFMAVRGLIRFIPLLNFAMMLSFRRTTVLDMMSYTRVYSPPRATLKKANRKKRGMPSAKKKESAEDPSPQTPSGPRPASGFDPQILDR